MLNGNEPPESWGIIKVTGARVRTVVGSGEVKTTRFKASLGDILEVKHYNAQLNTF
jgi:hypothetical protein